mmetsp:Transcript_20103/g.29888  ORF Transcript_20103/g.29888 Transcript_20103/m.29888 type:complete len:496 (+) Transcript_20103:77-1564(+)
MSATNTSKAVLILGAGLVSGPLVEYLANTCGYKVTVGSRTLARAEALAKPCENANALEIDVEKDEGVALLNKIVGDYDCVISMLPYLLHAVAAKAAVDAGKHFLTTSYVQPGVRALEEESKKKGVVMINECGVDPGTDHMSAMVYIDKVSGNKGKIVGFTSFCGGLPAPDSNTNPFGYKFSWAPRGVLLASANPARFLKDGKPVDIVKGTLFLPENYEKLSVDAPGMEGIEFEAYPNRDSTPYQNILKLPDAQLVLRGTYRYAGWCDTVQKFSELGFLSTEKQDFTKLLPGNASPTYAQLIAHLAKIQEPSTIENPIKLKDAVGNVLKLDAAHTFVLDRFEWLGLFDNTKHIVEFSKNLQNTSPLDVLCDLMQDKMQYAPGERDMILMQHVFDVEYEDNRKERVSSTMVSYGVPNGHSAMSRTVSYPVGIATKLVLEGKYTTPGLAIPTIPELYQPILDELDASFNIKWVHKVVSTKRKQQSSTDGDSKKQKTSN